MIRIFRLRPAFLPLLTTGLLAIGWTVAIGQSATRQGGSSIETGDRSATSRERAAPDSIEPIFLVREGTHLQDQRGHFELDGVSAVFVDDEGRRFGGLLNLSMQRVVEALRGSRTPEDLGWIVSGNVTEFAGRNYLLITRVVRRSASPDVPNRGTPRSKRAEGVGRTEVDIGALVPTISSTGR